ncbi:hypothetical protein PRNP1_005455 [Phytophthora ramorum]
MQFCYAILLVAIAVSANGALAKSSKGLKWYSCPEYTSSDGGSSSGEDAECAVYNALLCHPGVCETPKGVDPTIEVFVKRLSATAGNPKTARNVWLLQGGPGISSVPLESTMASVHAQLDGAVNVQASVLLLSSKLDTQAPHKYAEYLVGALDGGDKELVSFDYTTTGIVDWAQLATGGTTCGMELLTSYVKNGGDLEMLDKSCLDEMPELNLTISTDYVQSYMLTTDAYDGKYDSDLSSAQLDKQ